MTATIMAPPRAVRTLSPVPGRAVERTELGSACDERLFFAQVREDPRVELRALHPGPTDRVVVVSSGGCTALSLFGAGAGEVHAVDTNRTQNHLVELKVAAVRLLPRTQAIAFLGGSAMAADERVGLYEQLRPELGLGATLYWDDHTEAIGRGVIGAGVSERFIRLVCGVVRHVVHNPPRVERLLACRTLEAQRELFDGEWNTRAWRGLFAVLLNRWSMSRAYDPRFFQEVGRSNFAGHFLRLANHALTEVPVAGNYFLHQMFTEHYPVEQADGVPPYLGEAGAAAIAARRSGLRLVDGGITDHLRTLPERSVNAFALSNVCEWMDERGIAALFAAVERTAAPGARVVFRNFVGWTELPASSVRLRVDEAAGPALIAGDRSIVQSRVVVCNVGMDA